jgi:hypothetical protein
MTPHPRALPRMIAVLADLAASAVAPAASVARSAHRQRLRFTGLLAVFATLSAFLIGARPAAADRAAPANLGTTPITVNSSGGDQTFMGVGAVLGGGGNARYLMDYPEPQRGQILDYLFKPDYGASLQILKLEIGGGANSSDGSEPSIEPVQGKTINCSAGYEFAIAAQAVARNPDIKLYGLQWAAPGWVSAGTSPASIYTPGDIQYLIHWLNCARQWGLTISYLGGWNESAAAHTGAPSSPTWFENLRQALNAVVVNGVHVYQNVQIVANDLNWAYASSTNETPAISILGAHDICGVPTEGTATDVCRPPGGTGTPINTPQPLWASELGKIDGTTLANCAIPCAGAIDRALTRGYYETRLGNNNKGDPGLTGYLVWPVLDAMPAAGVGGCIDENQSVLPFENRGLVTADQPWSRHYCVNAITWAIAHFTQFVSPPDAANPGGWQYEDSATGYLLNNPADGSYVTFIKSGGTDWTTVIEATLPSDSQTVNFTVTGGLANKTVHVWSSDFTSGSPASSKFLNGADLNQNGSGQFQLTVQPHHVYTLTTTTGQSKGNAGTAPAAASFPLPYPNPANPAECPPALAPCDSLAWSGNAGTNDDEPPYLAAQDGSFELEPCLSPPPDGATTCTEQTTIPTPVLWPNDGLSTAGAPNPGPRFPYAIIGDEWMTKYTVSADVLLTQNNTSAGLIARFGNRQKDLPDSSPPTTVGMFDGYVFDVSTAGVWKLVKDTPTGQSTLHQGTIAALGTGAWHHLALKVSGTAITAWVDGTQVVSWTDSSYSSGLAGIEAGAFANTWPDVQYSNLKITSP